MAFHRNTILSYLSSRKSKLHWMVLYGIATLQFIFEKTNLFDIFLLKYLQGKLSQDFPSIPKCQFLTIWKFFSIFLSSLTL